MYLQIQFQLIFPSRRHKSLFLQFFPKLIINGSASLFPRHPRFFNHPSSMIIAGISKRHPLNGLIKNSNGALPRFSPGFNITTSHLPFSISPVFRCATRRERRNPFVSPIFVHRARPWKQCGVGNRCGPRHRRLWQADWCRRITHQDLSRLRLIAAFNRNSCGLTEGLLSGSTLPFFFFFLSLSFRFFFFLLFFFSSFLFFQLKIPSQKWRREESWFNERLSREEESREKLADASFRERYFLFRGAYTDD